MNQKIIRSSVKFMIFSPIIILIFSKTTSAQSPLCPNTTLFANNSRYETNLNILFRYLSSNATIPNGYYQAVSNDGNANDETIYGHFLCRGDLNASTCQDCVTTATIELPKKYCPNRKQALIWYDNCLVRYSNQSFFGKLDEYMTVFEFTTNNNVTGNISLFNELLGGMMNDIAVQAALGGSQKKFATNFVNYTIFQTIYGLGQCTPDLSQSDCNTCFDALGHFVKNTRQGMRIMLLPSCVVHYEIHPFFNLSPPSRPQPALRSSVINFTVWNNCNYSVWPAILDSNVGHTVNVGDTVRTNLQQGESKIIIVNAGAGSSVSVWGRTHCSRNQDIGNFFCKTGDCGNNGEIECQGKSEGPVAMADFRIGQFQNQDMYKISVQTGYNLPMMVIPQGGGSGVKCVPTGCVFNLDETTCPSEFSIDGENSVIACQNPCQYAQDCCKTGSMCQISDYSSSSRVFGKLCPRANNNPFDLSSTTFICEWQSYRTSYNITFCPSPEMTRLVSSPFFPSAQEPTSPSLGPPPSGNKSKASKTKVVAIGVPIAVLLLLISSCICHFRMKAKKYLSLDIRNVHEDFIIAESLMFELGTLQTATNNFSNDRKLGGGGYGNVYKGTLSNGQEIAVKRLTRFSDHGLEAFKNEAILIAKLQHKNLVRLLGFCSATEERLLVYEFVPNKSLDYLLFDPRKQRELDWSTRYNITLGIARGLLYLHEDSRPRIIHRDLKAPNILLEVDMNPKISDFGLARIFEFEQAENATSVIAGTYGYMAPEYAIHGQFSIKSDAYSFGVLLLEIVSGKKISSKSPLFGEGDLLTYAWRSWNDGKPFEILDPTLGDSYSREEVLRCIHLGLLCVQENSHKRPTMSTIIFMLNTASTTSTLPKPDCPRSFYSSYTDSSQATTSNKHSQDPMSHTHNKLTISDMDPR